MCGPWFRCALILTVAACWLGEHGGPQLAWSADKKSSSKKAKKKPAADLPPINLPDDPNAVVLTYDPGVGAGKPERKGAAPCLTVHVDGTMEFVNPVDGAQASGKLNDKEFKELLSFVVHEQDFLTLTAALMDEDVNKNAAAAGAFTDTRGIGNTVIEVKLADKQNSVGYRAATLHQKKMPKAELIARFAETEKRLADLAVKVAKGSKSSKKKS